MTPLIENLVVACIIAVVLFFAYHIAMHLIHKQTKQLVMEMNTPKHVPTVESLPGSPTTAVPQPYLEPISQVQEPLPEPALPQAADPNAKVDGSATFNTDLRTPENSYAKHAYLGTNEQPLPAQNEDSIGGISAWNGDNAQPFALLD